MLASLLVSMATHSIHCNKLRQPCGTRSDFGGFSLVASDRGESEMPYTLWFNLHW